MDSSKGGNGNDGAVRKRKAVHFSEEATRVVNIPAAPSSSPAQRDDEGARAWPSPRHRRRRLANNDHDYDDDSDDDDDDDENVGRERETFVGKSMMKGNQKRSPSSRKRKRQNEDELDDVDDYDPVVDGDGDADLEGLPSQRDLLEAKRERRMRRQREMSAETTRTRTSSVDYPKLDDDDDDDDEDDGGEAGTRMTIADAERSLASEGIQIEPFSMEQERTDGTGYFDGDTYVFRNRNRDEEPDAWLESIANRDENGNDGGGDAGSADYRAAAAAAAARRRERADLEAAAGGGDGDDMDAWSEQDLISKALVLVSDTETVMQAISRYGELIRRKRIATKKAVINGSGGSSSGGNNKTSDGNNNTSNEEDADESSRMARQALNNLTQASSALMLKGHIDIYQKTRNDLMKLIPEQTPGAENGGKQSDAAAAAAGKPVVEWEYQGSQDAKIHGPYTTEQMRGWIRQGYFVGPTAVQVRTVVVASSSGKDADAKTERTTQEDLLADLMEDDDHGGGDDESLGGKASGTPVRGEWRLSDTIDFDEYR